MVGDLENTYCPDCGSLLVERSGYHIRSYRLSAGGCCPSCSRAIPGRWAETFLARGTDHPYIPRFRGA
jgi:hypothetical protein